MKALPKAIKEGVSQAEADELKKKLEDAGAATLKSSNSISLCKQLA